MIKQFSGGKFMSEGWYSSKIMLVVKRVFSIYYSVHAMREHEKRETQSCKKNGKMKNLYT